MNAVAEAMEPGASVSAIARRIGIHPSQLDSTASKAKSSRYHRVKAGSLLPRPTASNRLQPLHPQIAFPHSFRPLLAAI
jgi:transposase-like protein